MSVKTTKDRRELEAFIKKWAQHYAKILLVTDHTFSVEYSNKIHRTSLMEHANMYPYKTCHLRYGETLLGYWKDGLKQDIKNTLIHELAHDITDPLYMAAIERHVTSETINNERERLTDHIANIIIALEGKK